jgi:hypothetical protein
MNPVKTETVHQHHFRVHDDGSWLSTRDKGAKACRRLEEQLTGAKGAEDAVLDFSEVEAMTVSFADEFIGRFIGARMVGLVPEVGILVEGLNPDTEETLTLVLNRRKLVAVYRDGQADRLLGEDEPLQQTFAAAQQMGEFKAVDLAENLGISPQNANNRLKRLVASGVLCRTRASAERGGKEFGYRVAGANTRHA